MSEDILNNMLDCDTYIHNILQEVHTSNGHQPPMYN